MGVFMNSGTLLQNCLSVILHTLSIFYCPERRLHVCSPERREVAERAEGTYYTIITTEPTVHK